MYRISEDCMPRITVLHTFFCTTFMPDYRFRGETHDFYELVCVLDGEVTITADDRIYTLARGQAILHPPMQFHNIGSHGDAAPTVLVVSFSGEQIPAISDRVCRIHDLARLRELAELGNRALVFDEKIWVAGAAGDGVRHLRVVKELELLLLRLADHTRELQGLNSRRAVHYSAIVRAMEDNLDRRLTVGQLAALCHLSKISLQKIMAQYAGVGVMEYYTRLRMEHAARLLEQGAAVKEAALAVGYAEQSYFSTVFKRVTGRSPSAYSRR